MLGAWLKNHLGDRPGRYFSGQISIFHENGDWVGRQSGNSLQITRWEEISLEEM